MTTMVWALSWVLLCLSLVAGVDITEQGTLQVDVREQALVEVGSKVQSKAAAKDKMLPLGDGILVYHFMVIVSPDDPKAGTEDGINILLTGSTSAMKESVPFAAGLTVGQVADLNVVTTGVGTITAMQLSMVEAIEDDVLLEFLSMDEKYGLPQDGSLRYTNFANQAEKFIAKNAPLNLQPSSNYICIVRTSSFVHAGTMNAVSIRFIGEDGSSEVMLLSANGFKRSESQIVDLQSGYPFVTVVKQIELSILFKNDDLWMPDSFQLYTPYQRTMFHNGNTQFIGYKPYVIASDELKKELIKAGKDYK